MSSLHGRAYAGLSLQRLSLGLGVLTLALVGIYSRTHFELASIWPANAFMLGMLLRFRQLRSPVTWLIGAAAFLIADGISGTSLFNNLMLNGCNLLSVAVGYALLANHRPESGWFTDPNSALYFLRAVLAAAFAAGVTGMSSTMLLFDSPAMEAFLLWVASELVNYIGLLPIILTLPEFEWSRCRHKRPVINVSLWRVAPIIALAGSAAAGLLVGGPGALGFPVPALLWCALTFRPFPTALLSFCYAAWGLLSVRTGMLFPSDGSEFRELLISTRVGVALVALAPLFLVSVMTARNGMLEKLALLASRDTLTGLQNRRSFLENGAAALADAYRKRKGAAVMMLDLDHFKAINDTHGHSAGDRMLAACALVLQENLRPDAVIGRIGGEEFAVVIPECEAKEAKAIAKRINHEMRSREIILQDKTTIRVTTSIGLHLVSGNLDLEQSLSRADIALYSAKDAGRDRFEFFSPVPIPRVA
jgi:diguanylate cyclase (GGDEF)-like protein